LFVIDDALENAQGHIALLQNLRTRSRGWWSGKVRVILVDQTTLPFEEELRGAGFHELRHAAQPLLLSSMRQEDLRTIAREAGARDADGAARESQGRPLDAILLAMQPAGSPESTIAEVRVQQALKLRTKARGLGLSDECIRLIAWAALTGGLRWDDLLENSPCREHARKYVALLGGVQETGGIPAIRPESLAHAFARQELTNDPALRAGLIMAWSAGPERFARSLFLLLRDNPDDPMVRSMHIPPYELI
jgi:hypothetical protein